MSNLVPLPGSLMRGLTAAAAADRLGVSRSTVWRMLRDGRLASLKPADVDAYLASEARWVTHAEAERLTGAVNSVICRAVRVGELHPRDVPRRHASLDLEEVLRWATERRERHQREREIRLARQHRSQPPNDGHVWLSADEAAAVLAVSPSRVNQLARAAKLPCERRGKRVWFRRDLIEQAGAARVWRGEIPSQPSSQGRNAKRK